MAEIRSIYRLPPAVNTALRQGEIISNLYRAHLNIEQIKIGVMVVDFAVHQYAVVLSQDCDLDQDFSARGNGSDFDLVSVTAPWQPPPVEQAETEPRYGNQRSGEPEPGILHG